MGMATPTTMQTLGEIRHAQYPNLTHCKNCDAVYSPGNWVRGYWDNGTAGKWTSVSKCKEGNCPFCGKEQTK